MSASIPVGVQWRKSSHSTHGACVELAVLPDGEYAIRNSNRLELGVLTCTRAEMTAFIAGARAGEFDDL